MTLRALVRYKCWKAAFQRTATYDYHGTPDTQGARGRLRMFKVVQAETAVQPKETLRTPEGSARLNSGHNIPRIGLGTWKSEKGQVRHAVYEALKAGYRHVDCAAIYENEHEVGAALQQAFTQAVTARNHVFITSKLWYVSRLQMQLFAEETSYTTLGHFHRNTHHSPERTRQACLKSLADLQLDYLDLYLVPPHTGHYMQQVVHFAAVALSAILR